MNRVLPALLFPGLILTFHAASAAPAPAGSDLAREYEQVRTIALRDPKVQKAFEKANMQLEQKIVEIDPALENYVKSRHTAGAPGGLSAPGVGSRETPRSAPQPAVSSQPFIAGKPTASRSDLQTSRSHVLTSGETLGAVASRYKVSVAELRRVNHIKDDRKLVVGQVIVIPGAARP
jgi:hypothetical protein